jgi:hypothetical protein
MRRLVCTATSLSLAALVLGASLWVGACSFQVDYGGTRYACDTASPLCPLGSVCSSDGFCVGPDDLPDPSDGPDGAPVPPVPPPDAAPPDGPPPPPEAPDAGPPPTTMLSLGERPNANLTGVTTDTYLDQGVPTGNFGGDTGISFDADPVRYSLLRFDTRNVPAGMKVVQAQLYLYVFDPLESGDAVFQPVTEDWSEGNATYNNRKTGTSWQMAGGTVGPAAAQFTPRAEGEYVIALPPALVQAWLDLPAANFGLRLRSTSMDGRGGQFRSSESDFMDTRPLLLLTLTPKDQPQ